MFPFSARNADLNILVLDACDQRIDQSQSSLWTLATQSFTELGFCEIVESGDHSDTDSLEKNDLILSKANTLVIINKSDLLEKSREVSFLDDLELAWCPMSCVTRDGLQHFLSLLEDKIKVMYVTLLCSQDHTICSPLPILSLSGVNRHDCFSPGFSILC